MIETVLKLLRKGRTEAEGLDTFSGLLLSSTIEQSLEGIDSARLAELAREAFQFLMRKPHKRHQIAVRRTELLSGAPGMPSPATLIEILNDDMPYVVESVMGELHSRGLTPLLVLHPIYKVARYGSGRLTAVIGPGDRNWAGGDQESYMALVLGPLEEPALAQLVQGLDGVLDDVRSVAADGESMRARLGQAISAYEGMQLAIGSAQPAPAPAELREAVEFLKWAAKGSFTLLGMREYEFVGTEQSADLWPSSTVALGVFRAPEFSPLRRGPEQLQITPEIRAFYNSPSPLIITKANAISRVRRRVHFDYIGIKRYTPAGKLTGELRLVGLFTPASYLQPVEAVPLVRQKVQRVLADAGFPPDSHKGRTLVDILETFPRDELFQIEIDRLKEWALVLLDLQLRPRTRVLIRRDKFDRYFSALVFVPRDQYSSASRERIGKYLSEALNGRIAAFYPYITLSPLVRTQFIIATDGVAREVPTATLEHDIAELLRSWTDRLEHAIAAHGTPAESAAVAAAYRNAFSAAYAETFSVDRAVEDIERIVRLSAERPVAIDFYREPEAPAHRVRAAVYRFDAPIPLSERVPLLENLGFRVIDERSYRVRPVLAGGVRDVVLHDMVLETADAAAIDLSRHDARMEDAFLAVFHGEAENDLFNSLVVAAGLDWREAAVLRALAAYLRQIRAPFGPRYIAETLVRYAGLAHDLVELFRTRFETGGRASLEEREAAAASLRQSIEARLADVQSLDEDRILRRILNLVQAIVRTNAFQRDATGQLPETLAFKLDCAVIDQLPEPRPFREIFVHSTRVEGIHLRFAAIARGGIRWSDRAQDFRTEVLGLAKAQQVKNTVIVPSGAKGGFVPKLLKRNAPRDETIKEGVTCYRMFISALLSLTDNLVEGRIVPPGGVVRHDGDDPYLVVAADKGTATFSDYANEIALERGFWLGDAFASGGSAGYDHKKLGITARGAWECVKRHFRELDIDIQSRPFRVAGVGDMSGDVFGNAMLLSPVTLLVAAFDHRDIFLDPSPDPSVSFAERKRLFELPRSSWADYDRSRLSQGGGIYSRNAKSIALSAEAKSMLGVSAASLTPAEVMQAILRMQADLLWFGGIGTFIRDSNETDEQVGDRANDAVRISAAEVRARVIGEGANLGVTQRGRIEAAARGVRLNTDFIDNSAGVNTSDQEVNIKLALGAPLAAGRLKRDERDRMLASMASDVAAAVLTNNYQQGLALSLAERTSRRDIAHLAQLARQLEERGLIERKLEALPSSAELAQRAAAGTGMTRPELAVLLSWSKIALNSELLAGSVPDDPASVPLLLEYFPHDVRERFRTEIMAHPLRREIIATRITNSIVNRGGPAIITRLNAETGRTTADIAYGFMTTRAILGLPQLWGEIDALDGKLGGQRQLDLYQAAQDLLVELTGQLLERQSGRPFADLLATYRPAAERLGTAAAEIVAPGRRARLAEETQRLVSAGVPAALAARIAGLDVLREVFTFTDRAQEHGATVEATARIAYAAAEHLRLDELTRRAALLKPSDEFDRAAIENALAALDGAHRMLTTRALADKCDGMDFGAWVAAKAPAIAAAVPTLDKILAQPDMSISRLAVAAASVRG